jgi:site-specific DNA-methyltransferase (adenine-specific)
VTERVIVASKGRFDRAIDRGDREQRGLPHRVTIDADRFMDATIDLWEMPPESATRVGHPAPFPVGLPETLIDLYTYEGDLVLDPFLGSGTTAVAAIRTHRHYVGMDTDENYVQAAQLRCATELEAREHSGAIRVQLPARPAPGDPNEDPQARATREGKKAKEIAKLLLEHCGFTDLRANHKLFTGVNVDFVAKDADGDDWYFDVSGAFTSVRSGLRRTDTVWKALGKAALTDKEVPYILLSSDRPGRVSAAGRALTEAHAKGIVFDVLGLFENSTVERLRVYAAGGQTTTRPARLFGD